MSAKDFYAYRIMIRKNQVNYILLCRALFHQYIVDMYVKIESERLLYIRLNQKKLRVDDYIHLRDAVINDNSFDDIGQKVILPSTYIGGPRQMHEYTQDASTYVRHYGRPDLFITFTCNPKWTDIIKLLQSGQLPTDRHDIIARVFERKVNSFVDIIVKSKNFGKVRCWIYTIEWQKRGLPHIHILIWLEQKIRPTDIDKIISAELPNQEEDPELFDLVSKHMIHGPCGTINLNSTCMNNNQCTKHFPKPFIQETQTDTDGYPLYRRRSPENGGYKFIKTLRNNDIEINNKWVVPYSPLLLKMLYVIQSNP